MGMPELNMYVAKIVHEQPEPPRNYDRKVLWEIVRDPTVLFLFGIGLLGIVGATWLLIYTEAWFSPIRLVWYAVGFIIGALCFLTPFYHCWSWDLGIRKGVIVWAEATNVTLLDENVVSGTWIVRLPLDIITEKKMTIDAHWASSIKDGSRFRVLLHPTRSKILIPIGP
jgi:hypothetical protein